MHAPLVGQPGDARQVAGIYRLVGGVCGDTDEKPGRARVADATLAHACVAVSVAFDLGDAALRRIARGNAPYDAVYACFALEIARLRSLADSS